MPLHRVDRNVQSNRDIADFKLVVVMHDHDPAMDVGQKRDFSATRGKLRLPATGQAAPGRAADSSDMPLISIAWGACARFFNQFTQVYRATVQT